MTTFASSSSSSSSSSQGQATFEKVAAANVAQQLNSSKNKQKEIYLCVLEAFKGCPGIADIFTEASLIDDQAVQMEVIQGLFTNIKERESVRELQANVVELLKGTFKPYLKLSADIKREAALFLIRNGVFNKYSYDNYYTAMFKAFIEVVLSNPGKLADLFENVVNQMIKTGKEEEEKLLKYGLKGMHRVNPEIIYPTLQGCLVFLAQEKSNQVLVAIMQKAGVTEPTATQSVKPFAL